MENRSKNKLVYLEWFEKADEDELLARAGLKEKASPSGICFLSQQMAEKYLKGLIVFHNQKFSKVHDLLELEKILIHFEPDIKNYEENMDLLNRYYIETRYPGDYSEFTLEEAKNALEAAQRIKDFVLEKVKK